MAIGSRAWWTLLAMGMSLSTWTVQAQLPQTRLYAIFPPGAQSGTSLDVKVSSGADLEELKQLVFNHPGIKAVQKTQDSGGKQVPVTNTFVVSVDAGVPAGVYDARTVGLFGLSNPRRFVVSKTKHVVEAEPNNTVDKASDLTLEQPVLAVIGGGADIDFYKLSLKKGQRVVFRCEAQSLDSRLSAAIEVLNESGRRLAYVRGHGQVDPVTDLTIPADGTYLVKIYDFVYRGGSDYGYRLLATQAPYIDFILPPAGIAGKTSKFQIFGRNLPGGQDAGVSVNRAALQRLEVDIAIPQATSELKGDSFLVPRRAGTDGYTYTLDSPNGKSNPVMIATAAVVPAAEKEPNDAAGQAQHVTVPGEFFGQFQTPGDIDTWTFDAKAKEVYYIEIFGDRNGSNADPYFSLDQVQKDDKGAETGTKRITAQDDNGLNPGGNDFNTLSDDPVFRFQAPADATYRLVVRDRFFAARGHAGLVYRLVIRKEQPDFRLVVLGAAPPTAAKQPVQVGAISLRRGDNIAVKVMAYRRDGFNGAIQVTAEGLPAGVTSPGAVIGPGQNQSVLILSSAEKAAQGFARVKIIGQGEIDDPQKVQAEAAALALIKPATDAIPKLDKAVETAKQALEKSAAALKAAQDALSKKPDDEGLKKKVTAAETAQTAAQTALKKAEEARAAGGKKVEDAQAAHKTAADQRKQAARQVKYPARIGTVIWPGPANEASVARLADDIAVAVLDEDAPFQVVTEVTKVEANQSRQVLLPMKLLKRNKFDNNVTLTMVGITKNSKVTVANKPINKGKTEELLRLFVDKSAPDGAYTLYFQTQGQVAYSRNPKRLERAKAAQTEQNKVTTAAAAELKKATEQRDAAKKKVATDTAASKKAVTDRDAAKKAADTAAAALKAAVEAKTKSDAAVTKATAEQQAAQKALEAAQKAKDAAPEDKAAIEALAKAQQAFDQTKPVLEKAQQTQVETGKKVTAAQQTDKQSREKLAAAQQTVKTTEANLKTAQAALVKLEQTVKDTDAKSKAAAAAKKVVDKEVTDATNVAKPKNINFLPPSTPIILVVKKAPVELAAAVPNGGNLKRGAKLDVKVTVKRINGYTGPVTLELPLPPNAKDLSAAAVTVPADQNEAVVSIAAGGEATEGQIANLVIRGSMTFNGKAVVDVPVTVKVSK